MKNPEKDGWLHHLAWVVLSLAMVGYLDLVTGHEVSVFLLYTVPVALATRRLGTMAGMLTAVAATAVWVLADLRSGHVNSCAWVRYVNAFNRMAWFILAVAAIRYLRAGQVALLRQIEAFPGQRAACGQCHRLAGARATGVRLTTTCVSLAGPSCIRRSARTARVAATPELPIAIRPSWPVELMSV